ncbi:MULTISPECIES: hypothetical protein [Streptosporangium]|uniref:GerMN domain-containing protein n=1 Tax=Streptosporangium brasiliense TaxID=47480 RepID=A0ABT9R849_9ACTN|nr:hypothetical protein [Streptosporangium brasiliense]MDP9865071.1 hypothetical protein [Streptosporangium brasiliense]
MRLHAPVSFRPLPFRPRWPACLLAAALTLGGCGIAPTEVRDQGRPPVISYSPTWVTVYLLRDGRLEPASIPVGSDSAKDIINTLFRAGKQPPKKGLSSALNEFSHYDTETTRYSDTPQRNDPGGKLGYRLNVIITGEGEISRAGLAQITCTIRQNKQESIWSVEVTRLFPGTPASLGEHTCFEYRDLAAKGVRLPP